MKVSMVTQRAWIPCKDFHRDYTTTPTKNPMSVPTMAKVS